MERRKKKKEEERERKKSNENGFLAKSCRRGRSPQQKERPGEAQTPPYITGFSLWLAGYLNPQYKGSPWSVGRPPLPLGGCTQQQTARPTTGEEEWFCYKPSERGENGEVGEGTRRRNLSTPKGKRSSPSCWTMGREIGWPHGDFE